MREIYLLFLISFNFVLHVLASKVREKKIIKFTMEEKIAILCADDMIVYKKKIQGNLQVNCLKKEFSKMAGCKVNV